MLCLSQVLVADRAIKAAMKLLEFVLVEFGIQPEHKVIIGNEQGDLHDIGKKRAGHHDAQRRQLRGDRPGHQCHAGCLRGGCTGTRSPYCRAVRTPYHHHQSGNVAIMIVWKVNIALWGCHPMGGYKKMRKWKLQRRRTLSMMPFILPRGNEESG